MPAIRSRAHGIQSHGGGGGGEVRGVLGGGKIGIGGRWVKIYNSKPCNSKTNVYLNELKQMNLYFIEHIRILVYYRMVLLTYSDEFQHFSVFTYVTVSFRLETSWDWRVCKGVADGSGRGLDI